MGLNLKLSSTIVHNQIKYRIRIKDLLWIRLRKKHVAPTGSASASLRDFLTVRTPVTQPMPMASQAAGRRIYYASIGHVSQAAGRRIYYASIGHVPLAKIDNNQSATPGSESDVPFITRSLFQNNNTVSF